MLTENPVSSLAPSDGGDDQASVTFPLPGVAVIAVGASGRAAGSRRSLAVTVVPAASWVLMPAAPFQGMHAIGNVTEGFVPVKLA